MTGRRRWRIVLRRVLQFIPVMLLVTLFAFLILHLTPGDPAEFLAGENPSAQRIAEIRHLYGLDRPLLAQYLAWLWHVAQGDLSVSLLSKEPVINLIRQRFPNTLFMVAYAMVIAIAVGAPLAVAAAARPGSWADALAVQVASFAIAVPYFWVGMVLVTWFAMTWNLFPVTGMVSPATDLGGAIRSATLPAIALSMTGIAEITRQLRAALMEVLAAPFVRTLRAKGLPARSILWKHGLKNVSITLLTVIGLVFGRKIGATVVIETVFAIPGIGSTLVDAAVNKDYVVVQGIIVTLALAVALINLAVDLAATLLDPRAA